MLSTSLNLIVARALSIFILKRFSIYHSNTGRCLIDSSNAHITPTYLKVEEFVEDNDASQISTKPSQNLNHPRMELECQ